jgi:hypothetical protein
LGTQKGVRFKIPRSLRLFHTAVQSSSSARLCEKDTDFSAHDPSSCVKTAHVCLRVFGFGELATAGCCAFSEGFLCFFGLFHRVQGFGSLIVKSWP